MLKTYEKTWHFYVRQQHYTSRRGDYLPYCMIDTLYDFCKATSNRMLDIGCGENNLKLFFDTVGCDKTIEADYKCWVGEPEWFTLPQFNRGIAINSLHWNDIETNIELALKKTKHCYITLNQNQDIDRFKDKSYWEDFGNVEYFWHGQDENELQQIHDYLEQDQLFSYRHPNLDIEETSQSIYHNTVINDPFYGVVRAIINAT